MHKANEHKKEHKYDKSIFNLETEIACNTKNNQKVNQDFEVDGVKYQLDGKHVDDLSFHDTSTNSKNHDPPQCELDIIEVKQVQGQDIHLSQIIQKCKSQHHHDKTPYHLDKHGIAYRKVWNGPNICHAIMVPQKLQPCILYESYSSLQCNGSTWLYNFIK